MIGLSSTVKIFFLVDYFDRKLKKTSKLIRIAPDPNSPTPPYWMTNSATQPQLTKTYVKPRKKILKNSGNTKKNLSFSF